jgi:hypothetical protein
MLFAETAVNRTVQRTGYYIYRKSKDQCRLEQDGRAMADKSRSEAIEDERRLASGFATLGPHASTPLAACPKLLNLSTNRNKTKFTV